MEGNINSFFKKYPDVRYLVNVCSVTAIMVSKMSSSLMLSEAGSDYYSRSEKTTDEPRSYELLFVDKDFKPVKEVGFWENPLQYKFWNPLSWIRGKENSEKPLCCLADLERSDLERIKYFIMIPSRRIEGVGIVRLWTIPEGFDSMYQWLSESFRPTFSKVPENLRVK